MPLTSPLTLSELQLLNQELLAALRSGVSIDMGLRESAQNLPGRLSVLADQLASHLSDGRSLTEALDSLDPAPPTVYRVVIAAGIRGNQLEEVLVRLNEHSRVLNELRESLRRASIYPLSLGLLAYLLTCFTAYFCVPPLRAFLINMKIEPTLPVRFVYALHDTFPYWAAGIPLLVGSLWLGGLAYDWWNLGHSGSIGFLRYLPGFQGMLRHADLSLLASLLAIQMEHGLPLPESLRRAADAVASPSLRTFCLDAAQRVEQGESFCESLTHSRVVPPVLKWMLTVPGNQAGLVFSAQQASEIYRERTLLRAEWIERMSPVVFTLGFGLAVVGMYCWAVMGSLIAVWNGTVT